MSGGEIIGLFAVLLGVLGFYWLCFGMPGLKSRPRITDDLRKWFPGRVSVKYTPTKDKPWLTWTAEALLYSEELEERDARTTPICRLTVYARWRWLAVRRANKFIAAQRRNRYSSWEVV